MLQEVLKKFVKEHGTVSSTMGCHFLQSASSSYNMCVLLHLHGYECFVPIRCYSQFWKWQWEKGRRNRVLNGRPQLKTTRAPASIILHMLAKFESEKTQIERLLASLMLQCFGMELINLLSFSKATRTSPVSLETVPGAGITAANGSVRTLIAKGWDSNPEHKQMSM